MPISAYPPSAAATNQNVYTRSQTFAPASVDMTTPDPLGVNVASFITCNLLTSNVALSGALFSVTVTGSNGDRFLFQIKPLGAGGWRECAAMDVSNGYWDYVHRTYDSGGVYTFAVPGAGAGDARMVRVAGAAGTGTAVAYAVASHMAFPSPPKYIGKRDVTLMVRGATTPGAMALVAFDAVVENDDRTRSVNGVVAPGAPGAALTSRSTTGGKRLWIQGWDAELRPNGSTDRVKINLICRPNGAVAANNANSPPKFEIALDPLSLRSALSLAEPMELQNSLGSNQGSVGIQANGNPGGGVLTMTVYAFETL